ncbi:MAG: alpha-D-glucose phosphate-specific phosphoglucomutase [Proteobacteria bacterium]|nr:alpha-D-glucose phosphate-specific phosphoglucomutase [Pseudomonadota bacterium]
MSERISPLAGHPATEIAPVDVPRLIDAYYRIKPDVANPAQRVAFGTSGHRGVSFDGSFNEDHVLAITQAICQYRQERGIDGPLFLGIDTHALSGPAFQSALEVLAANEVTVMIAKGGEYTPTPAVSHAILTYNRGRAAHLADGIVVSPSHNPPDSGGFKYNPPNGGPADTDVTRWIETAANGMLENRLREVQRLPLQQARRASTTREHDFLGQYVEDLRNVIDFDVIRGRCLRLGVDPLGGAGVHYWPRIAEVHRIDLQAVNQCVDATFQFMTLDWDGRVRMDPSSPHAMRSLIGLKDKFDVAFACDTDHDRHGIVTPSAGLLPANHYLAVCVDYLFRNRPGWQPRAAVGKTMVSSSMIDRIAADLGRELFEVPVGFKWFADGLFKGELGFGGEESAGSSFLRRDGTVWTTDKDGIVAGLLAAEMLARTGQDPGQRYQALTQRHGTPFTGRMDAPASGAQKQKLAKMSPAQLTITQLAGEPIRAILDRSPNGGLLGGIKVVADNGWFAARPSGTENIYKIYAESFKSEQHLQALFDEAQRVVDATIS